MSNERFIEGQRVADKETKETGIIVAHNHTHAEVRFSAPRGALGSEVVPKDSIKSV